MSGTNGHDSVVNRSARRSSPSGNLTDGLKKLVGRGPTSEEIYL